VSEESKKLSYPIDFSCSLCCFRGHAISDLALFVAFELLCWCGAVQESGVREGRPSCL